MSSAPIPDDEEVRLRALDRYAILDTLPERDYDDVTSLATYICGTPIALVSLVGRGRQWFKAKTGLGVRETARADSFCAHTVVSPEMLSAAGEKMLPQTLVVEDARLDQRFADNPLVVGDPEVRFYAGAPLVTPEGHVLGTVCVIDMQPRVLTQPQIAALEALSRQVMTRLELRLKVVEEAKRADALRTAEKLAVVGRLASAVAHEINNPLQSMTNLLFMAEVGPEAERSGYVLQAQEELKRVSHIVTQTLRFHRQSDKAAPIRFGEIVESVLLLFRIRLQHAAATVEVIDRQTVPLVCYGSDVRQVVANLIGNALDAVNGRGAGSIRVRMRDAVESSTGRSGVRLTVADSGSGMSAATRARLFEPFFSTKGARGTGLGLWVSRGILEKHGAVLRVKSTEGEIRHGTVFTVFFPLQME